MGRMTERKQADRARAQLARQIAAYSLALPVEELDGPTRGGADIAFARQVAMYLAHIAFEMSLARVGEAFGRDRSTAAHACHIVEDRRDDRAFDTLMDELEAALRALPLPETAIEACHASAPEQAGERPVLADPAGSSRPAHRADAGRAQFWRLRQC
ncbi:MAG: hypothetical protein JJU26_10630 [Oceanicaulis sp.]|nr:hypothetical protein [Oceanicaulis sp.]